MRAYYNEIDEYAAQWLRNLIAAGHITPGDVDTRSIEDVTPADLIGYDRCHFFAGIGVWDYALNRAGWGTGEVWTGSCPCQPFSVAGKGDGFNDERHLWPSFHWLIEKRRPLAVFGEQVASKDGYTWLDLVQADLEGTGYTVGAVVAPAAGFGAPHQRHRMYWVADTELSSAARHGEHSGKGAPTPGVRNGLGDSRGPGGVGNTGGEGLAEQFSERGIPRQAGFGTSGQAFERASTSIGGMADADGMRRQRQSSESGSNGTGDDAEEQMFEPRADSNVSFWSAADWIYCRDEKYRPVEPGTFPLAHGATARVGRLRAYGNAINAPQAEEFIKAYLETRP